MANVISESMKMCSTCGHTTLHRRNDKKINWVMHIVLILITGGIWGFFLGIAIGWRVLTFKVGGKSTCSVCGSQN